MAELAGDVKEGKKIEVLAQTEDWYQIRMNSDLAYVQKDMLRDIQCRTVVQEQRKGVEIDEYVISAKGVRSTTSRCKKYVRGKFEREIKSGKWADACRDDGGRLRIKLDDSDIDVRESDYSDGLYACRVWKTVPCVRYVTVKQEKEICE